MCIDDYGSEGDFQTETWRTARKARRCCACGETITAGHRYHRTSGKWDGRMDTFDHCARCWRVVLLLSAERAWTDELVDLLLDCGEIYEGDDPRMYELAFATADEAQAWTGVARG